MNAASPCLLLNLGTEMKPDVHIKSTHCLCSSLKNSLGNETLTCCVLVLSWQPLFSEDTGEPFSLLHSTSHVQEGVHSMEVLLLRIQKEPQETKGSGFCVSLEWITVANSAGQGGWCTGQLHLSNVAWSEIREDKCVIHNKGLKFKPIISFSCSFFYSANTQ